MNENEETTAIVVREEDEPSPQEVAESVMEVYDQALNTIGQFGEVVLGDSSPLALALFAAIGTAFMDQVAEDTAVGGVNVGPASEFNNEAMTRLYKLAYAESRNQMREPIDVPEGGYLSQGGES